MKLAAISLCFSLVSPFTCSPRCPFIQVETVFTQPSVVLSVLRLLSVSASCFFLCVDQLVQLSHEWLSSSLARLCKTRPLKLDCVGPSATYCLWETWSTKLRSRYCTAHAWTEHVNNLQQCLEHSRHLVCCSYKATCQGIFFFLRLLHTYKWYSSVSSMLWFFEVHLLSCFPMPCDFASG